MSLLEGRSWEMEKSGVANLCVTNGVKGARVVIWRASNPYCYGNLMRGVLISFLKQLFWRKRKKKKIIECETCREKRVK